MMCTMAFNLSDKVVSLHLDNRTAKAYLCKQGSTVSLFLSKLFCSMLNLADKQVINLIQAQAPIHLNVEASYLLWD